jgi:hypothetical protein
VNTSESRSANAAKREFRQGVVDHGVVDGDHRRSQLLGHGPLSAAQAEIEVQHLDDVVVVPLAAVLEATKGDDGDKPDRVPTWRPWRSWSTA